MGNGLNGVTLEPALRLAGVALRHEKGPAQIHWHSLGAKHVWAMAPSQKTVTHKAAQVMMNLTLKLALYLQLIYATQTPQ